MTKVYNNLALIFPKLNIKYIPYDMMPIISVFIRLVSCENVWLFY